MAWWIWILIAFSLLTLEFFATTLHLGVFAVGAFLVAGLVALGWAGPLWIQLMVFSLFSVVALVFIRPWLLAKLKLGAPTAEIDSLIGESAVALAEIAAAGVGKAEMRGATWNARNIGPSPIAKGDRCSVVAVDGLTIHLRSRD